MRYTNNMSLVFYIFGLCVMLSILYLGAMLDPELRRLGLSTYLQEYKLSGVLLFFGFVFAFPIGLTICILAGFTYQKMAVRYLLYVIALSAAISNLVLVWPVIAGREYSPMYFAIGGIIMISLISVTGWLWARQRSTVQPELRIGTDLQGIGYFCFAMATWHICGIGGLPGFAIHPDAVLSIKSYPFIIGQLKVVMLYFILAWLCTFLGFYARQKHA